MPGSGFAFAVIEIAVFTAAAGAFAFNLSKTIRLIQQGKPDWEPRWDRVPERLASVAVDVLGHWRLLRYPGSGAMHLAIFWGFAALFLSVLNFFWEGISGSALPFTEGWLWYNLLTNVFYVLVLGAVAAAAWRRLVVKPARLELTNEALLILGLIAGVIVTDIALDGAKLVMRGGPAPGAFVSARMADVWAGLGVAPGPGAAAVYAAAWWLHAAILLGFLNFLPFSKHLHIMFAPPNVFFRSLAPKGALQPIPGIEEREAWGAATLPELSWKMLLDGLTCTECGRCDDRCPANRTGKPLSPKKLHLDIKHLLAKEGLKSPGAEREQVLSDKWTTGAEVWACTTCRACETECPVGNEHIEKIMEYRRHMVLTQGKAPRLPQAAMQNMEKLSNPWGMAQAQRLEWAKGLGLPVFSEGAKAEYCWFVGCAGAFDSRAQSPARDLAAILKAAGVSFAVLGPEEGCCGDSARRLGNEYLFKTMAESGIEVFKRHGIRKVLTACPHGYNTLKNEYPQFGWAFDEVWHHTQFIARLLRQGRIALDGSAVDRLAVFHDPCYLGRHNDEYAAPREVLGRVPGLRLAELPRSGDRSFCCGAGGGRMWDEEHGERVNRDRAREVLATSAGCLAVACPFCLAMLTDGLADVAGQGKGPRAMDVASVVAGAMRKA